MSEPTVSAVVTAHNRRAYLAEAVASALASGANEVIVVRNFSGPLEGLEGRYRDLECFDDETGVKQAVGAEAAAGDLVAFLDDDDLWDPAKVPHLREVFGHDPDLAYYCHSQVVVDSTGSPAVAQHPEFADRNPSRFAQWDPDDIEGLFGRIWPGNNSSTVVRRGWALRWTPALREAGWGADRFWMAAALIDGAKVRLEAAPLTRLRLHDQNMSHARSATPGEFRSHHALSSARFARSCATLARIAEARGPTAVAVARHFREKAIGFGFFADLEKGTRPRRSAIAAIRHGSGLHDRAVLGSALVALLSPALARRLLYRSSLRRWSLRPNDLTGGAGGNRL